MCVSCIYKWAYALKLHTNARYVYELHCDMETPLGSLQWRLPYGHVHMAVFKQLHRIGFEDNLPSLWAWHALAVTADLQKVAAAMCFWKWPLLVTTFVGIIFYLSTLNRASSKCVFRYLAPNSRKNDTRTLNVGICFDTQATVSFHKIYQIVLDVRSQARGYFFGMTRYRPKQFSIFPTPLKQPLKQPLKGLARSC